MPVVTTDNVVQPQTNKGADVTAKKAGDLAAATVHLYTNDFTPDAFTTVGLLTEATFTGYAAVAVAGWNANEFNADGSVSTDATNVMTFVGPNDGSGQTVFGYYVLSAGAGTPLVTVVRFPGSVGLRVPTDVLALVATYRRP